MTDKVTLTIVGSSYVELASDLAAVFRNDNTAVMLEQLRCLQANFETMRNERDNVKAHMTSIIAERDKARETFKEFEKMRDDRDELLRQCGNLREAMTGIDNKYNAMREKFEEREKALEQRAEQAEQALGKRSILDGTWYSVEEYNVERQKSYDAGVRDGRTERGQELANAIKQTRLGMLANVVAQEAAHIMLKDSYTPIPIRPRVLTTFGRYVEMLDDGMHHTIDPDIPYNTLGIVGINLLSLKLQFYHKIAGWGVAPSHKEDHDNLVTQTQD